MFLKLFIILKIFSARARTKSLQHSNFRLEYGLIGESYPLAAASHAVPSFPKSALKRASELATSDVITATAMEEAANDSTGTKNGNEKQTSTSRTVYLEALAKSTRKIRCLASL